MHWASDSQLQFAVWLFFLSCLFVFVLFASAPVKQYYKIVSASFWEQVRLWFRWHLRIFLHSPSSLLPLQPDGTWLRPVGNGFRAGTFPWSAAEVCRGQSYNTRENWWNWKDCCGLLWTAVDCDVEVNWKWMELPRAVIEEKHRTACQLPGQDGDGHETHTAWSLSECKWTLSYLRGSSNSSWFTVLKIYRPVCMESSL